MNSLLWKFKQILNNIRTDAKIVVASSGGLDSTFLLFALKQNNFNNIISLTMKHLLQERNDSKSCCSIKDIVSLKDICWSELNIMHYTVDLHDIFSKKIKQNFINDVLLNKTPNPCASCNEHIKFGALADIAFNVLSADVFMTGHYARIIQNKLYKGIDSTKDQSYFLSLVPKEKWKNIILPLGFLMKKDIIKFSKEHYILKQLFKYKKESQGVCFITTKWKDYINDNISIKSGWAIYKNKIISRIDNINLFTIGQKWYHKKKNKFLFIIDKRNNKLFLNDVVAKNYCIILHHSNIIYTINNKELRVQFRYHSTEHSCLLYRYKNILIILVLDSVKSITPGQIATIYKNNCVVLGAKIYRTVF